MKRYSTFIFDSYRLDVETKRIELNYSLDEEVLFTEVIRLPSDSDVALTPDVDRALFALHLAGGISYYKTCLPQAIQIRSGCLTRQQAAFWNVLYEYGLREFCFQNKIDFHGRIYFPWSECPQPSPDRGCRPTFTSLDPLLVLVPVGGGKDSIVTIELLKERGAKCMLFRAGAHPLISSVANVATLPMFTVERQLASRLFQLNAEGALNGHVPITAYLSFLTILVCLLNGYDFVAMSNERSANEGNMIYHDVEVNHQWSKSLEFERLFVDYIHDFVTLNVGYASLLRPLSELHITKLFARQPQYFGCATSCNNNWKIAREGTSQSVRGLKEASFRWCGTCPKCASTYALLSAFLPEQALVDMFGADLFTNSALLPLYRRLTGIEGFKPFECVGTPDEIRAALFLAHQRGNGSETAVMKMFLSEVLPLMRDPENLVAAALTPRDEHLIPEWLYSSLYSQRG